MNNDKQDVPKFSKKREWSAPKVTHVALLNNVQGGAFVDAMVGENPFYRPS